MVLLFLNRTTIRSLEGQIFHANPVYGICTEAVGNTESWWFEGNTAVGTATRLSQV